jgi:8-oxo-dGTP pyrophosphatase MutT (NUDIX family)
MDPQKITKSLLQPLDPAIFDFGVVRDTDEKAGFAAMIIKWRDKFLLILESDKGKYRAPSGSLKRSDGKFRDLKSYLIVAETAAKRELGEETGIVIPEGTPIYYLGSIDGKNEQDSARMFCQNFFFCELPSDMEVVLKPSTRSDGEEEFVKDVVWLPAKDGYLILDKIRVTRNHLPAFGRAIRGRFYERGSR